MSANSIPPPPPPSDSPTPTITMTFIDGSDEYKQYARSGRRAVGSKMAGPDGKNWTVKEVKEDHSMPPDPLTGKNMVRVIIRLEPPKA